ncbi:MAG: DUF3108 domain-containing protein [Syntrophobacteraceae bacterium]
MKSIRARVLLCFLLAAGAVFQCCGIPSAGELPFQPGEKLTFDLRWGIVSAGAAVLQVLPAEEIGGVSAHHFSVTIRSNAFIDAFYKVRDQVDAYADEGMTRSLLYKSNQQEGSHRRNVTVSFDWENSRAQFVNFGKKERPVAVGPGTFDPLSVFYSFRLQRVADGLHLEASVTDGKKYTTGKARVVKRETVRVPAGTFDTFLVEPDLKDIGGVFKKSKNARLQVWVTADRRHVPVKIASKVVVGTFEAVLVSAENVLR